MTKCTVDTQKIEQMGVAPIWSSSCNYLDHDDHIDHDDNDDQILQYF